jgi:sulfur transfer protein SufE
MEVKEFQVCRYGREARWVVRLGKSIYGSYLDREQALLDAVDAARDALQTGCQAQVWLHEHANAARVF